MLLPELSVWICLECNKENDHTDWQCWNCGKKKPKPSTVKRILKKREKAKLDTKKQVKAETIARLQEQPTPETELTFDLDKLKQD